MRRTGATASATDLPPQPSPQVRELGTVTLLAASMIEDPDRRVRHDCVPLSLVIGGGGVTGLDGDVLQRAGGRFGRMAAVDPTPVAPLGYCFRVRLKMSELSLLDLPGSTHNLRADGLTRVWLASVDTEQPLRDAADIVIRGEGFVSEHEAAQRGERWRDIVSRALARLHLAADFGIAGRALAGL